MILKRGVRINTTKKIILFLLAAILVSSFFVGKSGNKAQAVGEATQNTNLTNVAPSTEKELPVTCKTSSPSSPGGGFRISYECNWTKESGNGIVYTVWGTSVNTLSGEQKTYLNCKENSNECVVCSATDSDSCKKEAGTIEYKKDSLKLIAQIPNLENTEENKDILIDTIKSIFLQTIDPSDKKAHFSMTYKGKVAPDNFVATLPFPGNKELHFNYYMAKNYGDMDNPDKFWPALSGWISGIVTNENAVHFFKCVEYPQVLLGIVQRVGDRIDFADSCGDTFLVYVKDATKLTIGVTPAGLPKVLDDNQITLDSSFFTNFYYVIYAYGGTTPPAVTSDSKGQCPKSAELKEAFVYAPMGGNALEPQPYQSPPGGYVGGCCQEEVTWETLFNDNPFGNMGCMVFGFIIRVEGGIFNYFSKMLNGMLIVNPDNMTNNDTVREVWMLIRNIINSLFVLFFLISALVTALHIDAIPSLNLGSYKLQRMVPAIIVAIFLVNFSFSIANFILVLANSLVNTFMVWGKIPDVASTTSTGAASTVKDIGSSIGSATMGKETAISFFKTTGVTLGGMVVTALFALVFIVLLIYLWAVLWIRKFVLVTLFMFAAIPYAAPIINIPAMKKYLGFWWEYFINWAMMGPIVALFLLLAVKAADAATGISEISAKDIGGAASAGTVTGTCASGVTLTGLVLASIMIYLAATQPLKAGGAIMKNVQDVVGGKKGVTKKIKAATVDRAVKNVSTGAKTRLTSLQNQKKGEETLLGKTLGAGLRKASVMGQKAKTKDAQIQSDYEQAKKGLGKDIAKKELAQQALPRAYELKQDNEDVIKKADNYGKMEPKQISSAISNALFDKDGNVNKKPDLVAVSGAITALKAKIAAGEPGSIAAEEELNRIAGVFGLTGPAKTDFVNDVKTKEVDAKTVQTLLNGSIGAMDVSGNRVRVANQPARNDGVRDNLSRRKFQTTDAGALATNLNSITSDISGLDTALQEISDSDLERIETTVTDPTALLKVKELKQRRVNILSAGQENMLQESINSPLLAGNLQAKLDMKIAERSRIKKAQDLMIAGDIESARALMETIYKKDMKDVSKAQMDTMLTARKEALKKIKIT